MKPTYAGISIILLIISVAMLILLTLFEASLSSLPTAVERMVSGLLLVLPAALGVLFGVLSLLRKESNRWLAIPGIVLNSLFALFHISVISFAG